MQKRKKYVKQWKIIRLEVKVVKRHSVRSETTCRVCGTHSEVEQWELASLISWRSGVRILLSQLTDEEILIVFSYVRLVHCIVNRYSVPF